MCVPVECTNSCPINADIEKSHLVWFPVQPFAGPYQLCPKSPIMVVIIIRAALSHPKSQKNYWHIRPCSSFPPGQTIAGDHHPRVQRDLGAICVTVSSQGDDMVVMCVESSICWHLEFFRYFATVHQGETYDDSELWNVLSKYFWFKIHMTQCETFAGFFFVIFNFSNWFWTATHPEVIVIYRNLSIQQSRWIIFRAVSKLFFL